MQRECLELLGCAGDTKALELGEVCGATALAGKLSLASAIVAGGRVETRDKCGRSRKRAMNRAGASLKGSGARRPHEESAPRHGTDGRQGPILIRTKSIRPRRRAILRAPAAGPIAFRPD
jgi:hypothetical protein